MGKQSYCQPIICFLFLFGSVCERRVNTFGVVSPSRRSSLFRKGENTEIQRCSTQGFSQVSSTCEITFERADGNKQ